MRLAKLEGHNRRHFVHELREPRVGVFRKALCGVSGVVTVVTDGRPLDWAVCVECGDRKLGRSVRRTP